MTLTFPTGPSRRGIAPPPGTPARAHHCVCIPRPMIFGDNDRCQTCGKHLKATVADTWEARAVAVATKRAKKPKR